MKTIIRVPMKIKITTLALLLGSMAFAQVTIDKAIFVSPGAVLFSDLDVDITATDALEVKGSLYVNGDITGASNLVLHPVASLALDAGTLTLSDEADEEFASLTLGTAGILEVLPGNSLTLTGALSNANTTNGIKLLADNTGYAQLLTKGAVTGTGTVYAEQFFTANANAGWRQIGSPVATSLAEIEDDFTVNYSSAGSLQNLAWYNASPASGTTVATGWVAAVNGTENFGPQTNAYSFYTGGIAPSLNGGVLDVDGAVGNGDYTFNVYATTTGVQAGVDNTGWNLIPNPYPSNINVSALLADNTNFDLAYQAIHVWDAKTQQYVAITDDVSISFPSGTQAAASHNIAPFQAFWVKGSSTPSSSAIAGESITLTNAHRTIIDNYNVFKTTPDFIRINAIAIDGALDQTVITFENGAEDGLDGRDAFKIISMNEEMPSLYTFADGSKMAINRKATPEPDKHIPMQFTAPTAGEFTIDMVEESVSPAWMIELEDHKTGTIHNMRSGDYLFTNDPSFGSTRFTVHINKTGESITSYNAERVYIHSNDDGINVVFGFMIEAISADVLITNLAGQTLYNGTVPTDTPFIYPVNREINMYVVHVVTDGKVTVEKIIR